MDETAKGGDVLRRHEVKHLALAVRDARAGEGAGDGEPYAVTAHGLEKSFGHLHVLMGIDLRVRRGDLFGLIGPSGAGKTVLVRLLAGLSRPSAGRVRLLGVDPLKRTARERERMGYMPQGAFLFPGLTVLQNAEFVAGLYGIGWLKRRKRIRELLKLFELWDARSRRASQLSGGMQRRLALACAVIHSPEVVFVDEPTVGLDPILRARIWDYLHALRSDGTTIILTTQYVEEAPSCDVVAVVLSGRIIAQGTPERLRREAFQGDTAEIEAEPFTQRDANELLGLECVLQVERTAKGVRVVVDDLATAMPRLTQFLTKRDLNVRSITPRLPNFDEVFAELVSRHG